jgi:hypothetical protein
VAGEVTVEDPIPDAYRHPFQRDRPFGRESFGDDHSRRPFEEDTVSSNSARAKDPEMKAMEMHHMEVIAAVDHAPPHRVAGGEHQALGVGPGPPVHCVQLELQLRRVTLHPTREDEDAIVYAPIGRVDDECAHELPIDVG